MSRELDGLRRFRKILHDKVARRLSHGDIDHELAILDREIDDLESIIAKLKFHSEVKSDA
jgi:hypothetical protein